VTSGAFVIATDCVIKARGAEWTIPPDVPVNVTVPDDDATLDAAVRIVLCAVPGTRLSVAGLAVTPAGNPVIATATVPLNPFTALAVTLTGTPAAPPTTVRDVGDSVSAKSGGGAEIVAATVELCVSAPEVAVSVSVAYPGIALAAAVMVTLCAIPGVKVSVAGCAVTPAGSPVIATATVPVKPFAAVAVTLTCCPAAPGTSVIAAGVDEREKSPAAGADAFLLLQDVKAPHRTIRPIPALSPRPNPTPENLRITFEIGPITTLPNYQPTTCCSLTLVVA